MDGCIYRTKDGECDLYSEGGKFQAFCDPEHCDNIAPTNADRIRAMTDKDLAKTLCVMANEGCPPWHDADISVCHNHGVCHDGECWLKWLKQEAKE